MTLFEVLRDETRENPKKLNTAAIAKTKGRGLCLDLVQQRRESYQGEMDYSLT